MASELIKSHKDMAEVYQGEAVCNKKIREILESNSLPNGLLPIDIIELGHNKAAGFVWIKQQQKTEKKNPHINKIVRYDTEITFFIEKCRVKKATGVKSKDLLILIVISDIYIEDPSANKITFATPAGITRQFPISAFVIKEVNNTDPKNKN